MRRRGGSRAGVRRRGAARLAGQHGTERRRPAAPPVSTCRSPRRPRARCTPSSPAATARPLPHPTVRSVVRCVDADGSSCAGSDFLAGALLLRRLLARRLLRRSPPLAATCSRRIGQQLVRPLGRHLLEPVALAERRVGLAVGDVHAEAAVLGDDRLLAHRVGAELAQRPWPPVPAARGGTPSAGRRSRSASSSVTVSSRSSLSRLR